MPDDKPKVEKAPEEEKPTEEAPKIEKAEVKKEKPRPKLGYKLDIVSERKNPLMKRTEFIIQVAHNSQSTPTRVNLTKEIVKVLKINEDVILIEKIFSDRGRAESKVRVLVYKDKKDIPKFKLDKLEKRTSKGKAKPEVAPKQHLENEPLEKVQPKEEKPAEIPKEEGG
ncbi:MAG: hypothetical protein ABIF08_02250 [Nanoarchaeota archaeon]